MRYAARLRILVARAILRGARERSRGPSNHGHEQRAEERSPHGAREHSHVRNAGNRNTHGARERSQLPPARYRSARGKKNTKDKNAFIE